MTCAIKERIKWKEHVGRKEEGRIQRALEMDLEQTRPIRQRLPSAVVQSSNDASPPVWGSVLLVTQMQMHLLFWILEKFYRKLAQIMINHLRALLKVDRVRTSQSSMHSAASCLIKIPGQYRLYRDSAGEGKEASIQNADP